MRKRNLFIATFVLISGTHFSLFAQTGKTGPYFQMPANIKPSEYMANTIILKIKSSLRNNCGANYITIPELNVYLKTIGISSLVKKFPSVKAPTETYDKYGRKYADLSLIYEVKYTSNVSLEKAINDFYRLGIIDYAQPHYIPHSCFTPNDTYYSSQYNVSQIRADSAWNVETGDTNVVIGITDTGTELTHTDLKDNIKYNYADPINGVDDDGDGYTDNFQGWDLGENDNDPSWQGSSHGVHVCGIAAASANNSNGIAGIGYKCKFLPVKIADHNGILIAAYEGIQYAADHGCAVINCSWGGTQGGQYGQDIVNYATINKNALVVAAAGNDGANELFYPACYQYVFSIAATDNTDTKASFSNYGYGTSVCAPGVNIYSTWPTNSYTYLSGTSMASPCASGAAAIVKSYFPTYTGLQVAQRLIVTADNIDAINTSYKNMLGTGRINLYHALTAPASPSVVMTYDSIVDNNNNIFITGDTLRIRGIFTNYLAPTTNLVATLSTTSPYVTIQNNTATLGAIATLGAANNYSTPFTVKISSAAPTNTVVDFELTYTDGSYTAHQFFSVTIDVDYLNITINDIATTITSKGLIGFDGPNQTNGGLGFRYKGGQDLFYECGLMIGGKDTNHVSDYIRNTSTNDAYFQPVVNVHQIYPPKVSQFDLDGYFNDAPAPSPLPVMVHHQAFAWNTPGNTKYVIVQYTIYNSGGTTLSNLYAGVFADWDVDASTYNEDRSYFDAPHKLGYARYYGSGKPFVGIASLSATNPVINYSVDNNSTGDGGVNIYYGITTQQKYYMLSHHRDSAGYKEATGDDICEVVSNGPFSLNAGDSVRISFALIAGDSLQDLEASADSAYNKINPPVVTSEKELINSSVMLWQNYPNPANTATVISLRLPKEENADLSIYNVLGEKTASLANGNLSAGVHEYNVNVSDMAAGIYYYRLTCTSGTFVKKMIIVR